MSADLLKLDPRLRSTLNALRSAQRTGMSNCTIRLVDGSMHDFVIADILDDALLGSRVDNPMKACLVQLHTICMIEFGA